MTNCVIMEKETFQNMVREAAVAYKASNEMQMVETARSGISKQTLVNISKLSGLSIKEMAELLPVSLRTIQRYKNEDILEPAVSERVLLIAEVLAKALDVFGSLEDLQHWLHTPSIALDRQTPISLLDTSFGARLVTDQLGRIEHGIYS